jgi:hypothetical protein
MLVVPILHVLFDVINPLDYKNAFHISYQKEKLFKLNSSI